MVRLGVACSGIVWRGWVRQCLVRFGTGSMVWLGRARSGQARSGVVRPGEDWPGKVYRETESKK
jgi:hypothetical protein